MHAIDGDGATEDGRFQGGSPAIGQQATVVTAEWLNAVADELISLVTGLGGALSKEDNSQIAPLLLTALASKLSLAGGTMSGVISMNGNKITSLGAPTSSNDAARKVYVDDKFSAVSGTDFATNAQAIAKALSNVALTPDNLDALDASTSFAGLTRLASNGDAAAGSNASRALTVAALASLFGTSTRSGSTTVTRTPILVGGVFVEQIIQTGSYSGTSGSVVFPVTFPNQLTHCDLQPTHNSNIGNGGVAGSNLKAWSTSGFDFASGVENGTSDTFSSTDLTGTYYAVGY